MFHQIAMYLNEKIRASNIDVSRSCLRWMFSDSRRKHEAALKPRYEVICETLRFWSRITRFGRFARIFAVNHLTSIHIKKAAHEQDE